MLGLALAGGDGDGLLVESGCQATSARPVGIGGERHHQHLRPGVGQAGEQVERPQLSALAALADRVGAERHDRRTLASLLDRPGGAGHPTLSRRIDERLDGALPRQCG